jgi:hypothetical protein
VAGLDFCYLAVLAGDSPKQSYLLFFTDYPPGFPQPPGRAENLFLPGVRFTGYFYKVAKFQDKGKREPWLLPTLVGKTLQVPMQEKVTESWLNLLMVFLIMALPVVLIALLLPRFFRHRETRQQLVLESFRDRRSQREADALDISAEFSEGQGQHSTPGDID